MSKIILNTVNFSNMFSYGDNNTLKLDTNRLTQLSAVNGSGKSSISFIIQELLFNKNVKGIKKSDLLNRRTKSKNWEGTLDFTANNIPYRVVVKRTGATTKVQLLENKVDISEHKVLDTYKKISDILGFSFEVFSQLTYQSSTDLLDFLKATDTNRKKFLIKLFNLEKYLEIGDSIKLRTSELDKEFLKLQGELKSIEDFLAATTIPDKMVEIEVPSIDNAITIRIEDIKRELANISNTCKSIDKNNMRIKERDSLQFELGMQKPEEFAYMNEYQALKTDLMLLNKEIAALKQQINSVKIKSSCDACGQPIDNSHILKMKEDAQQKLQGKQEVYTKGLTKSYEWDKEVELAAIAKKAYINNLSAISNFEQLVQVIDNSMPTTYPNYTELTNESNKLKEQNNNKLAEVDAAITHNKAVSANNAKVEALIEQKIEFTNRQSALKDVILSKSDQLISLNILKKAFSTSGIVAFKLENLTKELEQNINYYLSLLSDGQFQVEFILDKEKLNISVIDNGIIAPIETTSGGEFSRIQTAVLLAIRNLLSKLAGTSINLLFLDEIMGVLDDEGKEKLIEVLQKEHELNVFLICHEYTHPLIDKVTIIKENNISSIQ